MSVISIPYRPVYEQFGNDYAGVCHENARDYALIANNAYGMVRNRFCKKDRIISGTHEYPSSEAASANLVSS